ncbi:non-homologous end joining protein Ku [Ideonella sp. BN130291]|uniref:non-homologous end joining protein Ku n=1 Tax=Ideonella sp. BN130291 TaxID=3112940 RepID=UPI002E270411|nr:Ku protein [Ideonella sp. BN130291]
MAARSIASLSLTFGLVSIPVRVFSGTESSGTVSFNLLTPDGSRVKQQYISQKDGRVVERSEMIKGYEFEKDRFVTFTKEELKALEEGASPTVDIVAFIPEKSVDPIFYDKAYLLAPDKRGAKPYALLAEAMRRSGRCALATWAWKSKQYPVQIRPAEDGLVLQQLLYADEVRSLKDLDIERATVSEAELKLALQIIEQISEETYDPTRFKDTEKERILAAIDEKIAGKQIVAPSHAEPATGAQVIDLVEALRASLRGGKPKAAAPKAAKAAEPVPAVQLGERKSARRATPAAETAEPARKRARGK